MSRSRSFPFSVPNRRIALGFAVAALLIALGFGLSLYSYNQYREDTELVRHTYDVVRSLDEILSLTKDVEGSGRGYLITNDTTYLEPYKAALRVLPGRIGQLRQLVGDNHKQTERIPVLHRLVQAKIDITRLRVENRLAKKVTPPTMRGQGKQRMEALRHYVAMMIATEQALMESRHRQADRSFQNTLILISAVSLLTFVVLAVSYRLLGAELKRRQQNEDQLRAYEAQLQEQIRQLETSNDELERFAFVASHDLQEPLRKIQSFASLLADRYASLLSGEGTTYLGKITHSAERMSRLIKDLLNFSRVSNQREGFQPVHLGEIVQRILDDQELRIRGLNVAVDVGALPVVEAIPSQMDHLFTNLISNALKFTRPGTRPHLRIHGQPADGGAYPDLIADRRYYAITVEDNGIGFDEKYLAHIFKVFQRLHGKTEYEGTGIGLAICKRVVVHHHGYITAHSRPGEGATFVVVLPERQSLPTYDRFTPAQAHSHSAG